MAPTRGACDAQTWAPRPIVAGALRAAALLFPLIAAVGAVRLVDPVLFRPGGFGGVVVWLVQAAFVGVVTARVADRVARRLLPLATLYNMSLVFPDRAPSRYSVALRAGTIQRLRRRTDELAERGLCDDVGAAALDAIALVSALGRHDRLTRGHTERVRAYADLIGEQLDLDADERNLLSWGVILHDIGKITVPSELLNKAGRPTDEEWTVISGHPEAGGRMIEPLTGWLGDWGRAAAEHHEKWDGTGYPAGLAGDEISLAGRITAVADAFDVITSKRSYKRALSNDAARRELVRCSGTQFDPAIVRAFLEVSLGRRRNVGSAAALGDGALWGAAAPGTTVGTVVSVGLAVGTTAIGPSFASPVRAGTPTVERSVTDDSADPDADVAADHDPTRSTTDHTNGLERGPDDTPVTDDTTPPRASSTTVATTPEPDGHDDENEDGPPPAGTSVPETTAPPTGQPQTTTSTSPATNAPAPSTTVSPPDTPTTTVSVVSSPDPDELSTPPSTTIAATAPTTTAPTGSSGGDTIDDVIDNAVDPVTETVDEVVDPVTETVDDVVDQTFHVVTTVVQSLDPLGTDPDADSDGSILDPDGPTGLISLL